MSDLFGEAELRDMLLNTNEEYKRLVAEHKSYAEQLDQLTSRHHLNDEERMQEITLKKKKLMLKDQMYSILQKYRKEVQSEARPSA
jgi:uncharacterized protein YdcH (DUF465 family)